MDWGVGRYEETAARLAPAAAVALAAAEPRAGEHVLDLGCGTGNAALLAAGRGARVTGVDPSPRLVEVARARAAEEGLDAEFHPGHAARLPLADGAADVVLSVFGIIFAPDAGAAAAELARVAGPRGRVVLTAWIPSGAIHDYVATLQRAVAEASGRPPGPPGFAWHDREALEGLLGPFGFRLETAEHELAFTATSARDYLEAEARAHPLAIAGLAVLRHAGTADATQARALEILEAANEDPAAFRVTSRYVVATARREP